MYKELLRKMACPVVEGGNSKGDFSLQKGKPVRLLTDKLHVIFNDHIYSKSNSTQPYSPNIVKIDIGNKRAMEKLRELKINSFQLAILLNKEEKEAFRYLLREGVYCIKCNDICENGVVNYSGRLDSWNNVVIDGQCASCGNPVCRVMEFGEDPTFFVKATEFRKSIQN